MKFYRIQYNKLPHSEPGCTSHLLHLTGELWNSASVKHRIEM